MSAAVPAWGGPKSPRLDAPPRVAGQLRRTASVDMSWPDGSSGELVLHGRGRDVVTRADGGAEVLASAELHVVCGPDRVLRRVVTCTPFEPRVSDLVGLRVGPGFRAAAVAALGERHRGSLLGLLVDDLPVTALISGFGMMRTHVLSGGPRRMASVQRIGTCAGWRDGGAPALRAVAEQPGYHPDVVSAPPPVVVAAAVDPDAWHEIPPQAPLTMRRRRRIDVTPGSPATVEAWFRDTAGEADGSEAALHEYTVRGAVDLYAGTVVSLEAIVHVLPYADCPSAAPSAGLLDGTPLRALRMTVRSRLSGVVGCTHLNDALRSVADVDHLAALAGAG